MCLSELRLSDEGRVSDHGTAVAVAGESEVAGDELAKQVEPCGLRAVADGERAAGVVLVGVVAERGVGAEVDVGEIDLVIATEAADLASKGL